MSLFQNAVSFDEALAVFRPTAYKTEVLKESPIYNNKSGATLAATLRFYLLAFE
jgi:hypothetical protein